MDCIFFEKYGQLCAQHALNMLLQGFYFSAEDLAKIANDLDNEELKVLSPEARLNFKSHNYDDTGFFSLQVIQVALQNLGFIVQPYEIHNTKDLSNGYICNFKEHWFAVRKLNNYWFILDSVREKPILVSYSDSYCDVFFAQLKAEGYSIFSVIGNFTPCPADSIKISDNEDDEEKNIAKAIQLSLKDTYDKQSITENVDVQKAMEASLKDVKNEKDFEEDYLLEEAIKLSLMEENLKNSELTEPCSTNQLKKLDQYSNNYTPSAPFISSSSFTNLTNETLISGLPETNNQENAKNLSSNTEINDKLRLSDENLKLREKRLKWLDKL